MSAGDVPVQSTQQMQQSAHQLQQAVQQHLGSSTPCPPPPAESKPDTQSR
ncbi:hypothetical protein [Streptomyces sp. XY431]|nr:hypothetical protein [Streptomyces sp. XY431]